LNRRIYWPAMAGVKDVESPIEVVAEFAPQILKAEWERVKREELAFRLARNWIAPLIVLVSLAFVIFLWSGKMKI
jgi:hypothetical protein